MIGAGEPDFPTPDNVKPPPSARLCQLHAYTATSGYGRSEKIVYAAFETRPSSEPSLPGAGGGKQAIFNAMATLLNPGDDVLIPSPYWVTFPEIARFLRAHSVFIDTEPNQFLLTADMVRESITPRSRILIINSPNNPTGRIIPPGEYEKIVEAAAERDVWVISDECYLYFAYPPALPFTAGQLPEELRSRVMICGSFSKSHAMTGWRVGFALGPHEWMAAMLKVQSHSTSNASSISQKAAVEAATGPQADRRKMLDEYKRRRDWLVPALNEIPGVQCSMPEGAFYVMPDVRGLLGGRARTSADLSKMLLDEARVVVTDGAAFGIEGFLRLSYANSMEAIQEGVRRLGEIASGLRSNG